MKQTRRKFSAEFKARVSVDALRERETLAELAKKYEVSPAVISKWKEEFLEKSKMVFESKEASDEERSKTEKALYEKIGKLEMKLDFAKRASEKLGIPLPAND